MFVKISEIIIRSILAFIILLFLGRLVGRKLISRITFFDFLIGVTLGSLAVRIALGDESSFYLSILSGVIITLMVILTDILNIKSYKFRKIEEGEPVIIIKNGRILDSNLKKVRISLNKLIMMLREKNVFDISDVNFAIIENDGELSVMLKSGSQNVTAADLKIPEKKMSLTLDLIIDGKIIYDNLNKSMHDKFWLTEQLSRIDIASENDVFYACLTPYNNLYVSAKIRKSIPVQ